MPSPFPGMDPYLEQEAAWQDFHQRFIPRTAEALGALVRPRYYVKIEELVFIHHLEDDGRQFLGRGDVALTPRRGSPVSESATTTLEAPLAVELPAVVDTERHSYLEVRDRDGHQLVTVLELLSPSNKRPGPDRAQYEAKRNQLLESPVHFVEMDLLRGGPRMPMRPVPDCHYCVLVSQAEQRPRAGLWPIRLRDRLPVIQVPVRTGEKLIPLDLQAILDQVYDNAGYEFYIYDRHPNPPLAAEDAAWAQQFVPAPSSER